jgi:hypothetical protein
MKKLVAKGFATPRALNEALAQLERARIEAELSRQEYATKLKLLELELAEAKVAVQAAEEERARVQQLASKQAVSAAEVSAKELALTQAQFRLARVQVVLELFRRAEELARGTSTSSTEDPAEPTEATSESSTDPAPAVDVDVLPEDVVSPADSAPPVDITDDPPPTNVAPARP